MDSGRITLRSLVGLALLAGACGDDSTSATLTATEATTEMSTSTASTSTTGMTSTGDPTTDTTASSGTESTSTSTSSSTTANETDSSTSSSTTANDPLCGDGDVDPGEECDDGNTDDSDECIDGCLLATCGDGFVQAGVEACDDGNTDNTDACVDGCVAASCGDGFVGPGEACDDGNQVDDDECTNACALASCGDGVIQPPEQCDDGNADDNDECISTCLNASCGDGFVQDGVEACDDGDDDDNNACLSDCTPASCGDGFVQMGVEECDDANPVDTDECLSTCVSASCGDGFVQMGVEECDDGNDVDDDGCQSDCKATPGAIQSAVGWYHTCALTQAGAVHCWGRNNYGQLGQGTTTQIGDNELPNTIMAVDVGAKVTQLTAGEFHTCALTDAGNVRCWGRSNVGQLGYGTTASIGDNEKPSAAGDVNVGGKVTQVIAGRDHTCALLEGGKVRCWGSGTYGQTGHANVNHIGDNELPSAAGDLNIGANVTQLAAGEYFTCALQDDLKVRCWGYATNGSLGYGNTTQIGDNEFPSTAGPVVIGADVTAIAAGRRHICAIATNQTVRCWGLNGNGQLGYGHTQTIGDNELPQTAGFVNLSGGKAVALALGYSHSCALLDNNQVRCWGNATYGQLGQGNVNQIGDNEPPSVIAPVDLGDSITQIDANWYQTCGRTTKSGLRCWGRSEYGQLGYGNVNVIGDNEVPVVAGTVPFL
ncbi:MAG: DUF4215 domain-containing protein [Nannocystaceae bacterium]